MPTTKLRKHPGGRPATFQAKVDAAILKFERPDLGANVYAYTFEMLAMEVFSERIFTAEDVRRVRKALKANRGLLSLVQARCTTKRWRGDISLRLQDETVSSPYLSRSQEEILFSEILSTLKNPERTKIGKGTKLFAVVQRLRQELDYRALQCVIRAGRILGQEPYHWARDKVIRLLMEGFTFDDILFVCRYEAANPKWDASEQEKQEDGTWVTTYTGEITTAPLLLILGKNFPDSWALAHLEHDLVQPPLGDTMSIKEGVNADQAAAVSHDVRDVPTEIAGVQLA